MGIDQAHLITLQQQGHGVDTQIASGQVGVERAGHHLRVAAWFGVVLEASGGQIQQQITAAQLHRAVGRVRPAEGQRTSRSG
jgi:hypothetical protein